ncbi:MULTISPECIES: ABC transporter substrate-binding protein [Pseudomonadaceae]|uniref:Benzoate transport, extracellular ligand-binding receptor n=5 Tax=Pseudomonadaceae TaxID=135621 RepID=A0A6F8P9Z1_PSEAI|nr:MULTISPECIES: ABC transporter substrate-binding protein [Pseudomonadaceae]APU29478.1 ABC transporter permease [Pseudomonas alcaliphila JAB1]ELS27587.1 Benzoate transport, extracellular ligand-binding receptor [Pseudomonas furukawaii]BAU73253.1 benzoate transport [Pseudomonas furukawaii]BBJ01354.1 benzoate transport, extracellular ligand-binding receptor [Pseudomonas abietaniphila]BBJ01450.1 benzoate transport, extracellular ligand-binding receptor [Pseudomonas aeruginosa]
MNKNKKRASTFHGLLPGILFTTLCGLAHADEPIKIGLLMSYSGTYAAPSEAATNGLKLAIEQYDNQLGGRPVEYVVVDDGADPGKAVQNMQRLVSGANVDVVVGPIHSGVGMAAVKVARETGVPLIIPNAGFNAATGPLCAPNIFRTSFSSWQTAYPMGQVAADRGYQNVITLAWRYGFGTESVDGFKEGLEQAGGKVLKELYVPFPEVEFQSHLTEIAALKPDAVFVFFAGGGAAKFVQDYAASGLQGRIPLLGSGFLTEGTLEAQGQAAEGLLTTLHYAEGLATEKNLAFRQSYRQRFAKEADVYAVQGYDAGLLLAQSLQTVGGNSRDREAWIAAMEQVRIDSPRGEWRFSKAHNPMQNIYLREVQDGTNVVVGTAAEALSDPALGCEMN